MKALLHGLILFNILSPEQKRVLRFYLTEPKSPLLQSLHMLEVNTHFTFEFHLFTAVGKMHNNK